MACGIIDGFEAVQIDKDQRMTLPRLTNRLQESFEVVFKADPVCQVGQGIVRRAVTQPLCALWRAPGDGARLGDILNNDNRADTLSIQRAEWRNAVMDVKRSTRAAVQHHVLVDI